MHWIIYLPGFGLTATKAVGLVLALRLPFRKWLAVKLWLALSLAEDLLIGLVLWLGFDPRTSILYAQVYYWSDLIVVFAGLVVLLRLAETALADTRVDLPMLRGIVIAILGGVIVVSFGTVFAKLGGAAFSLRHLIAFANEAEQNMAAAGMIGGLTLWAAISVLRVPGVRIRRIVAGFGIFYSAGACAWSIVALIGVREAAGLVVQLLSLGSIALLAYAMAEREDTKPTRPPRRLAPAGLPEGGTA